MSDKMYYSAKNNGFYPESMRESYEASKNGWPDDATEISMDEYYSLLKGQEEGKVISPDKNGRPVLTEPVIDYHMNAETKRADLLTKAASKTADWRTELQLDTITDSDKASLIKWMDYIKALKTMDFTSVTDEAAYNAIAWPVQPQYL